MKCRWVKSELAKGEAVCHRVEPQMSNTINTGMVVNLELVGFFLLKTTEIGDRRGFRRGLWRTIAFAVLHNQHRMILDTGFPMLTQLVPIEELRATPVANVHVLTATGTSCPTGVLSLHVFLGVWQTDGGDGISYLSHRVAWRITGIYLFFWAGGIFFLCVVYFAFFLCAILQE